MLSALLICLATLVPLWAATPDAAHACAVSGPVVAMPMCGEASGFDTGDGGYLNGSLFLAPPGGLQVVAMDVYVGAVQASPRNQFALAIYQDAGGQPGALVAHSAAGTLTPNAWNALPVAATLQANTPYWLVYAASATDPALGNMAWDPATGTEAYSASPVPFGTWPAGFGPSVVGTGMFAVDARSQ